MHNYVWWAYTGGNFAEVFTSVSVKLVDRYPISVNNFCLKI